MMSEYEAKQLAITGLKLGMEYINESDCCANCTRYSELSAKCRLNPAIDIPVRMGGRCKFFEKYELNKGESDDAS